MILHTVVIIICVKAAGGALTITTDKATISVGDNVTLTCESDIALQNGVRWEASRYAGVSQTFCSHLNNSCTPNISASDSRYTFSSYVAVRRFFMTITGAKLADSQNLTCADSSAQTQYVLTITIKPYCDDSCCKICWMYWCFWAPILIEIAWTGSGLIVSKSRRVCIYQLLSSCIHNVESLLGCSPNMDNLHRCSPIIDCQGLSGPSFNTPLLDGQLRSRSLDMMAVYLYMSSLTMHCYARAYNSLKKTCGECSLVALSRINSVSMRKYTATLTQMLNLDKYQIDWVCRHLGHTKSVHKAHYRQMSDLIERVHITKLFLVQDLNLTQKFREKKLEDIDVSEIVFPADTTAADTWETDAVDSWSGEILAETVSSAFQTLGRAERPAEQEVFQGLESSEEDSEEEEEVVRRKATKVKVVRQRWDKTEMEEIHRYFKLYLDAGIVPRTKEVTLAQAKSKRGGGSIWKRSIAKVVKKISAMNHKKTA